MGAPACLGREPQEAWRTEGSARRRARRGAGRGEAEGAGSRAHLRLSARGWGAHPPAVPPRVPVPGLPYLAGSAGSGRGRRRGGGRPREDARPGGSAAAGGRVGTWGEELGWGPGLGTWAGRPVHSPRKAGAARSISPLWGGKGDRGPQPLAAAPSRPWAMSPASLLGHGRGLDPLS